MDALARLNRIDDGRGVVWWYAQVAAPAPPELCYIDEDRRSHRTGITGPRHLIAQLAELRNALPRVIAELAAGRELRDSMMRGPFNDYTEDYDAARRATDAAMGEK